MVPGRLRRLGPVALFLHGYPTSSYLWRNVLPEAAAAGYRAIAPTCPASATPRATCPGHGSARSSHVERFRRALGLEQVVLGVHDWGGLIGLRWACDHPGAVGALVITDTGFFPDGRWHGMAKTLRTEGEGEQVLENLNRELLAMGMRQVSPALPDDAIDEYWKAYGDADRRRSQLDLYRSGDFSKLEPYDGKLGALGVPAVIVWGAKDEFAPGGRRIPLPQADARCAARRARGRRSFRDGGRPGARGRRGQGLPRSGYRRTCSHRR